MACHDLKTNLKLTIQHIVDVDHETWQRKGVVFHCNHT